MRPLYWELKHPQASYEMLGFIPRFLSADDPRDTREQLRARYIGGWHPRRGFRMLKDRLIFDETTAPDNPPHVLVAEARLRDETIRLYDGAWVAVIQADGSFEVARID